MLSVRAWLVALILAATALFAVGVAIERSNGHDERAEATATFAPAPQVTAGEAVLVDSDGDEGVAPASEGESAASEREPKQEDHSENGVGAESAGHSGGDNEEILGIDAEATPFVVLAVLASLALALAARARPSSTPVLITVSLAMLAFAAFDLREVFHQADESKTGLEVVAGVVAALHLAAALVAAVMLRRASEKSAGPASEVTATIGR